MLHPSQLKNDVLDVVWGIFDEDGDGRLTKAEFMDVSVHAAECSCASHAVLRYSRLAHRVVPAGGAAMVSSVVSHRGSRALVCNKMSCWLLHHVLWEWVDQEKGVCVHQKTTRHKGMKA
jgi:hypothetical protein